jgi:hypothetical protein
MQTQQISTALRKLSPETAPLLDDDTLLNSAQTRARCGNPSPMSLWRWQVDPVDEESRFPKPDVVIAGRNYWRAGTVRRWLDKQQARTKAGVSLTNTQRRQRERELAGTEA